MDLESETQYSAYLAFESPPPQRLRGLALAAVLVFLLLSGACNFILLKILYNSYGEASAFFVSQGINVLYIVYGGLVVYPRLLPCGVGPQLSTLLGMEPITPRMRAPVHQRRFMTMGILDCFGTFLTAMGAVYVPGQYQPLLNQSLIPATMVASFFGLGTSYSCGQLAAAVLIIGGAALSVLPQLIGEEQAGGAAPARPDDEVRGYALLLYWLSNVPMACSAVYKEARFSSEPMDVTFLTQWVSIWQCLFGFALAPLQVFPGVGSADGKTWDDICDAFVRGWHCFSKSFAYSYLQQQQQAAAATALAAPSDDDGDDSAMCGPQHALLLIGYVGVNFLFNTTGLYLTKHGGAVLNSISYSLLLPLTTILFSVPLLGEYRESVFPSTYLGLLVVMAGFAMWRYYQLQHDAQLAQRSVASQPDQRVELAAGAATKDTPATVLPDKEGGTLPSAVRRGRSASGEAPASFQERIVGIGRLTTGPTKRDGSVTKS